MASVWQFGKPSLFITMTANAHWPKINAALKPGETPSDRPDLVTRVFCMKLKTLINDVVRNHHLGIVASYVYTIEFQKRGLPHGHIMVILEPGSVPRTPEEIDCLVTAKIPDPNQEPLLYNIVKRCMVHGPCNPSSMCWEDGKCSKQFPKPFTDQTTIVEDAYPSYRRQENGRTVKKSGTTFNNGHVVPYNKYLLSAPKILPNKM
jgi:hypothetical protein